MSNLLAWELYKQDKLNQQIVVELNCGKSKVTRLLRYAAAKHGETLVDGRSRRAKLAQKHNEHILFSTVEARCSSCARLRRLEKPCWG